MMPVAALNRSKRRWWILITIVLGVSASAFGAYFFVIIPDQCRSNERDAMATLKMLSAVEADFRANDRDWNHVNDFWTGDVAGLYYIKSHEKGNEKEIHLIDRGVAEADGAPLKALVQSPIPYRGYVFIVLDEDDTLEGSDERIYRQDTGGNPPMGKVHNTSKFGFCAYPAKYGVTGHHTFIVNENNTVFKLDIGGKPVRHWPNDSPTPDYLRGELR
jgi:hypothetical protein